jgi:hypothetical protein
LSLDDLQQIFSLVQADVKITQLKSIERKFRLKYDSLSILYL